MEFTNSRGVKYYLHKRVSTFSRNKIKVPTYFFRKERKEDYSYLPPGYTVKETRTGLPVVKKL